MRDDPNRVPWSPVLALVAGLGLCLALAGPARAGKLGWLDEVVQEVVREAELGGKTAARGLGGDGASTALRGTTRLFTHEADEGLEILARRSDDLARTARRTETASEALLQRRFARLIPHDPDAVPAP